MSQSAPSADPKVSRARTTANNYTFTALIAVAAFVFLDTVPFLPTSDTSPVLPVLVAGGLALLSLRRRRTALGVLYGLVLLTILWQWLGFGLVQLAGVGGGNGLIALTLLLLALNLVNLRIEPTSMALAILAVPLMITPYYYLSIPLIVAAAILGGVKSVAPLTTTFVFTLLPFLEIDNALYFIRVGATKTAPTAPILFSQLSDFAANIRPPLSGFNIALTGSPQSLLYPGAGQVANFLANGFPTLVIPFLVFSLVFGASTSLAGLLNTIIGKFKAFERMQKIMRLGSPVFTSVVTSAIFVALLAYLSPVSLGGYVTGLTQDPSVPLLIVAASVVLGIVIAGREYFVEILETRELARDQLLALASQATKSITEVVGNLDSVSSRVPSLDLSGERATIEEYRSFIADVVKGVETANYQTLSKWIKELQVKIIPGTTNNIPENLRIKVVTEVNTLVSLANTYNASLIEAKSDAIFPELRPLSGETAMEPAVLTYANTVDRISRSGEGIFASFVQTSDACNTLLGRERTEPPMDPASLFAAHDYSTGMKLLAQEYWLGFHIAREAEFSAKAGEVKVLMLQLEKTLRPTETARIAALLDIISTAPPAKSPMVLEKANELLAVLGQEVGGAKKEIEELEAMMKDLTPAALRVGDFEATNWMGPIGRLEEQLAKVKPVFDEIVAYVKDAIPVLESLREAQRRDESKLVIISQYQTARHELDAALAGKSTVGLAELPFQIEAARIFAKIYASSNRAARYNEIEELITIENA
jgi:hypothetical protein